MKETTYKVSFRSVVEQVVEVTIVDDRVNLQGVLDQIYIEYCHTGLVPRDGWVSNIKDDGPDAISRFQVTSTSGGVECVTSAHDQYGNEIAVSLDNAIADGKEFDERLARETAAEDAEVVSLDHNHN